TASDVRKAAGATSPASRRVPAVSEQLGLTPCLRGCDHSGRRRMTRKGWALFVALGVIWGIPYLLVKVAVSDLRPTTLVLLRTAEGALLLVPLAAVRGSLTPVLAHWRAVVVYTLVEVAVPWLLLSNAETHLTSSLTGLLIAAVPLIGAVLGLIIAAE